ncbi:MAG: UvrD-helicase domain-containing protein [Bryobacteraceae bacterium]|jgi:ATP-dependent exoDNAse (exonuclease V) beta subunit
MPTSDAAARARALDATTSFIVQAPAGSGKTELLIQRYLKLLSIVDEPEEIVAITFTKKAGAEMRARVVKALQRAVTRTTMAATGQASLFAGSVAAADAPLEPHQRITHDLATAALTRDREAHWGLLENPARIGIGTIDSLCASLTRRMPWTSRFGAFPRIEEKAQTLYREAARRTLRSVERDNSSGQAVQTLLLHLDNDTCRAEQLIAQMLERRDQWLRLTGSADLDMAAVRKTLEASLTRIVETHLRLLCARFSRPLLERAVDLAQHSGALIDQMPGPAADELEHWQILAKFLLTADGRHVRKRVDKNIGFGPNDCRKRECEQLFKELGANQELSEALCELRHLPSPNFSDDQWHALEAIIPLLPRSVAELREVFGEREQVDFAELTISANRALEVDGQPTDLALALGYRIRHILVDEFQDTSFSQRDLLLKLTAEWDAGDVRSLFLVGDPMQSIYRFREAEVGLFLKARRDGLGDIPLEPLTLSVNFRSTPAIVDWVNRAFTDIMPRVEDIVSGAVPYSESTAGKFSDLASPAPVVHAFIGEAADSEAERVLHLLRDATGTTAILVRARRHLTGIIAALKREGVPFQAIEIDQLAERPLVQDLMALTFALLHPADRVSHLAVRRAPWCGLTLADLLALGTPQVSADGAARLARIKPILDRAIQERGRRRLRELVEGAWIALAGPSCVQHDSDLDDAAAYFDLLEELDEGGDLSSFGELRQRVADLFAKPDTRATDAVQVMTIHKAKGLEFDTVILPGLSMKPKADDSPLLLWQELADGALVVAPIPQTGSDGDPVYKYLSHLESARAANETARLLYVAATRARKALHLLGCLPRADATPPAGSFLKLLWPLYDVQREFANAFADDAPEPPRLRQPRTIQRLPLDFPAPSPPPAVRWDRAAPPPDRAPEITFEWVGDTLRHAGTVLHGCVQQIAREGLEHWPPERIRASRPRLRTLLANVGVTPHELDAAVSRVATALLNCVEDPRARWMLSPHAEHRCEYAITGWLDGRFVAGTIDRTFVDSEGVRWIIDYKTSAHEGAGLAAFLDNEKLRYRDQLERYARLLALTETRPIRLGLYFPLLRGWLDWQPGLVRP